MSMHILKHRTHYFFTYQRKVRSHNHSPRGAPQQVPHIPLVQTRDRHYPCSSQYLKQIFFMGCNSSIYRQRLLILCLLIIQTVDCTWTNVRISRHVMKDPVWSGVAPAASGWMDRQWARHSYFTILYVEWHCISVVAMKENQLTARCFCSQNFN